MRVLLAASSDDSNVGYEMQEALRSVGVDALSVCEQRHPFKYPESSAPMSADVGKFAVEADVIDFYNSISIPLGADISDKAIVVQHGGGRYRRWPDQMNSYWNRVAAATVTRTGDLYGLGAERETFLVSSVDTDLLRPRERPTDRPLVVGHFPSRSYNKGTDEIAKVLKTFPDLDCRISTDNIPWRDHLERVADCDVIVETIQPKIDGKPFAEPGVMSREAAALGCIVITNSATAEGIYKETYGEFVPWVANNPEDLDNHLCWLSRLSREEVQQEQRRMRRWVVINHSRQATGERLLKSVYRPALEVGPLDPSFLGLCSGMHFYESVAKSMAEPLGHNLVVTRRHNGSLEMRCKKCDRRVGAAEIPPCGSPCVSGPGVTEPCDYHGVS